MLSIQWARTDDAPPDAADIVKDDGGPSPTFLSGVLAIPDPDARFFMGTVDGTNAATERCSEAMS
ncbi:hypothetical protein GCM10011335_51370 [Aureimonas glaciei]|uniref:Uncharacterized protein n=1 Tax=Aureimonas glaciei TaxID=1776957 RepID=A0A917DIZ0_9HYPH|nr:hypothetical protein GCM10011335_51370 [Aureimonas glaciei]